MPRKKKVVEDGVILEGTENKKTFKCLRCGKEYDVAVGHFYKNTYGFWKANDNYVPVCKECVNEMFDDFSRRFGSDRTACMLLCHILDVPFYNSLYDSVVANSGTCRPGAYNRLVLNGRQYQFQTFSNTLVNGELNKNALDLQEEKEQKRSKAEIQAKDDCISVIVYDPFDGYN